MKNPVHIWHKAPFLRLLFPFIAGIIMEWRWHFSLSLLILFLLYSLAFILIYSLLPVGTKFRTGFLNGIHVHLLFVCVGGIITWLQDVRNKENWVGKFYEEGNYISVRISEPPVENPNSIKAIATIIFICNHQKKQQAAGRIIIYFKKNTGVRNPAYGDQILFSAKLQTIKNTGNPGGLDYKTYCLFQGIAHQIYLSPNDFVLLPGKRKNFFLQFIFDCRSWVVSSLKKYIHGKKEQGLAEALLIGYKDDLDKNLVQSYTNTGVVHIIAISGMHLALIYGLLVLITKPLSRKKKFQWLRILIILSGLWLFSFLAGAQASVVRSTLMFTCIALGELLSRKTSIYNSLSLSAFFLLCYDPFWLWDVGFQLSYAAVLSIIIFYKPVYHLLYLPNKLLDGIWQSVAISLAAQIITTPISLYHFHQFPVVFLLTNLVAVPLSSLVLFGEIIICAMSWFAPLAKLTGYITSIFIYWMNSYIERLEKISFALWSGFSISIVQTILLTACCCLLMQWMVEKKKSYFIYSCVSLLFFLILRSISFIEANQQKEIIIYNIPKHLAMDLVEGRKYNFIGDAVLKDPLLTKFHLLPSRILYRISNQQKINAGTKDILFYGKKILILDSDFRLIKQFPKPDVDILILSKNPKLYMKDLVNAFSIRQIVIDASVPAWKAQRWKKDGDSLRIPCYDLVEKGVFIMKL